jgi:hypothetical protein
MMPTSEEALEALRDILGALEWWAAYDAGIGHSVDVLKQFIAEKEKEKA